MRTLYPPIRPNSSRMLSVGGRHQLYLEECGNPEGIPVVFVHGGPGGGCRETDRCFFDPEVYRIILFDQRGAGRSQPHACLEDNHTPALIGDMEKIRETLGVERWLVFGGSWGSTLSLLYAQAHPERVLGLVLRGIFLCRSRDIEWFYKSGASEIFPDYWQDFICHVEPGKRENPVAAYYQLLTGDNELERMGAAKAWSTWEGRCATLDPSPAVVDHFSGPRFALALARIECHYFVNDCFIRPDQILAECHRLADIPGVIVHGRYDIICPVEGAFSLARAWPGARLEVVRAAGHSSSEPGIADALVRATDAMAKTVGSGR